MIKKLFGDPHPKPSWTMIKDGRRVKFGPRPWKVLWNKFKQIVVFSFLLVPSANALNQYDYRKNVRITNEQLLIGTTVELSVTVAGLEASKGNLVGTTVLHKFGHQPDCDTGTDPCWIWDGPTTTWVRNSTGRIHGIYSDSGLDDDGNTGCREINIDGVNNHFLTSSETVTMDGQTHVLTLNDYVVIHRMECTRFGSTKLNQGTIYAFPLVETTTIAVISPNIGQTLMAIYAVPKDKDLYLTELWASVGGGKAKVASVDMQMTFSGFATKRFFGISEANGSPAPLIPPLKVPGRTVIELKGFEVSVDDVDIDGGFNGYLVDRP
jgi:hypothetical protein